LPGIEDVNMYDNKDSLIYTSFPGDTLGSINPNCKSCHKNIAQMFPRKEKSYKIITTESKCRVNTANNNQRFLLIRSPILNAKSCYQSSCHAHKSTDDVLGSLIIQVPLKEFDSAVEKSSFEFYILAIAATLLLASFLMLFTRREIKKPLHKLIQASIAVASGDKNMRLEVKSNQLDDMRMVSSAFNEMLDNLQAATTELENWSQQLEYKIQKKIGGTWYRTKRTYAY
jgi:two-component system NtrC family sensor kinase